jgi:hypothetical protein
MFNYCTVSPIVFAGISDYAEMETERWREGEKERRREGQGGRKSLPSVSDDILSQKRLDHNSEFRILASVEGFGYAN